MLCLFVSDRLLVPLSRETLDNVARLGPRAALTGPIARSDHDTVARQLEAVTAWNPHIGSLYDALADATRRLAERRAGDGAEDSSVEK